MEIEFFKKPLLSPVSGNDYERYPLADPGCRLYSLQGGRSRASLWKRGGSRQQLLSDHDLHAAGYTWSGPNTRFHSSEWFVSPPLFHRCTNRGPPDGPAAQIVQWVEVTPWCQTLGPLALSTVSGWRFPATVQIAIFAKIPVSL